MLVSSFALGSEAVARYYSRFLLIGPCKQLITSLAPIRSRIR